MRARSTDEAPCKYCLWGICKAEIRRVKPKSLEDLMEVVTGYVGSLDEAEVRKAVESKLMKYKRESIEE